jgi:hypothetical protein
VPPVILKIDSDAPSLNLAPVQFRNWDQPGIAIRADKAAQHAVNLLLIANALPTSATSETAATIRHYADYLRRFAGQLSPELNKTKQLAEDQPPPPEPEAA